MHIIYVKISSFRGISPDAEHYYGGLIKYNPYSHEELKFKLTASQAAKLNEKDPSWPYWEEGMLSGRFDSKDDIRHAAIQHCTELYNDDEYVLIEGNPVYMFDKKECKILSGLRPVLS